MAQEICYNCKGRGHGDGDMWLFVCPRCNGSGILESAQHHVYWTIRLQEFFKSLFSRASRQ